MDASELLRKYSTVRPSSLLSGSDPASHPLLSAPPRWPCRALSFSLSQRDCPRRLRAIHFATFKERASSGSPLFYSLLQVPTSGTRRLRRSGEFASSHAEGAARRVAVSVVSVFCFTTKHANRRWPSLTSRILLLTVVLCCGTGAETRSCSSTYWQDTDAFSRRRSCNPLDPEKSPALCVRPDSNSIHSHISAMTVTSPPPAPSNQPIGAQRKTAPPQPETAVSSSPTSLAAFSKHGRLLSPRNKNQLTDAASSASTARTSSIDSSHDWDDLSSTSSGDQDLDGWVTHNSTCPGVSSHLKTVGTSPSGRWGEPQSIHTLRHAAAPTGRSRGASWNAAPSSSVAPGRRARASTLIASPQQLTTSPPLIPTHHHSSMSPTAIGSAVPSTPKHPIKQGLPVGSPLQLTPVQLAALASQTPASFAPRLRPVVHAIHIGPPTEYDFRNTNGLMKCVNAIAPQPSPEQLSAKHLVINELQRIVDEWMRRTFPEEDETTATLLLGGSWHLKVGTADSDLDIVALLPKFVTSEVFFSSLYEHLKALPSVSKLVAMNKATVPILAFQLHQVRIDLLFARFTQNVVPKNLPIHSDQILSGMDATSMRSLSVPRVASLILELVPNDSSFRSCLRIIRLWAKRRGIYSNKAGFLGGISWTILVAFVCQMFPKATISSVIHRFFSILSTWQWPMPILLAKPYDCDGVDSSLQWCPQKHHHDRGHVMPIITPGFPAVNSAVNVNASTLRILKDEFARGKRIMDDMLRQGLSSPAVWQKLFAPSEFLIQYDHYVVVEVSASNDDELTTWSNFVASRTRKLVETLHHSSPIQDLHPFPELVQPHVAAASDKTPSTASGYYFVGFNLQANPTPDNRLRRSASVSNVSGNDAVKESVASAIRYFMATELDKCPERRAGMSVEITYRKWQELPESVFPQGRTLAAGERARHILSRAHVAHGYGRGAPAGHIPAPLAR
jgi:poly(A) polymerase